MKKIRMAIAGGLVLVAAIVLLLRGDSLKYNPVVPEIGWRHPSLIAANAAGDSVVLNGRGQQLVFRNREGRVTGMVCAGLTKTAFCHASSVAMSDDGAYVADCLVDGGGKYANGVRVARFSLDGEYRGTVFEERFEKPLPSARVLKSLVCHRGRLYGVALRGERLEAVEIADGKMKTVRAVPDAWTGVRGAWYFPERDQLLVTTFARAVTLYSGDGTSRRIDAEAGLVYSAAMAPDGRCYLSDRVGQRILRLEEDGSLVKVASVEAFDFQVVGDRVMFSNAQTRSLQVCEMSGKGEVRSVEAERLSSAVRVNSSIAWAALAACGLFLLAAAVALAVRLVRRRGRSAETAEARPLGMLPLYAANLVLIAVVLVVVTLTLTASYCSDLKAGAEQERLRAAESLCAVSPLAIGDALDRIDFENGCDGADYRYVRELVYHLSDTGTRKVGDLDFMIVRWRPGEPLRCLVSLTPWQCGFGDRLTAGEEGVLRRTEVVERIDRGEIWSGESEGAQLTMVPLRNSKGALAGVACLSRVKRDLLRMITARLTDLSIDLASILLVLVMLFGEGKLLVDFLKLRREQAKRGEAGVTRCEAHRPILILQYMLLMQFLAFLPTLARESALSSGLTAGIFAVLPVIIVYGGDYPLRMILQERAQRAVRTYYQIGCAVDALAFLTLIAFAVVGGYWLLLGSVSLLALGTTLTGCCCTAVRACGKTPEDNYRMLVFTNMEPAIGTGIGAALGAFVYEKFGLVSVGVSALVLTATLWTLVRVFIRTDINRTGPDGAESAGGGSVLRFVFRPSVLSIIACIVFPIVLVETFQAYTLPVYNEEQGNSVVLIGLALMVIQFLSLFTVPQVLKLVDRIGNSAGMVLSVVVVLGTILLYAFIPSMTTILLIVFAFNVLSTVVLTCAERTNISLAEQAGVSYPSAAKYLILGEGLAYAVGGPLFGYLQCFGYQFLGFAVFFALLALLGVYLVFGRPKK